ncbi:MAG: diguanylate cyclase [Desulfobacterales bacterium]|nr:diguanylate cyclase [Desulfobacterales bacterium]MDD4464513.1 diguanylate cyclase [Desulfobacterales bacterium]
MKILIAEDDATSRFMLQAVIVKWGFIAATAFDGRETWEMMRKEDAPKLVLLDWMMPEMDGLEVVRRVRALKTDRPPYIIMLTARGEKEDIIAGLDAGANDYLSKPFDPGELRARIEVGRRMVEMQDALVESREILAHQATHDVLTGLLNRRAILDRLREELARAGRQGDVLAVGMCDIDHFKQINDTYGHHAGDDALRGLAKILGESLRAYDSVGRVGGEEFLVIAPIKAGMDCIAIFNRLCARVAGKRMETGSGPLSVTVSIGVACADDKNTVDEILAAADAALYRAKNQGRNRVVHEGKCLEDGCPCAPRLPGTTFLRNLETGIFTKPSRMEMKQNER